MGDWVIDCKRSFKVKSLMTKGWHQVVPIRTDTTSELFTE